MPLLVGRAGSLAAIEAARGGRRTALPRRAARARTPRSRRPATCIASASSRRRPGHAPGQRHGAHAGGRRGAGPRHALRARRRVTCARSSPMSRSHGDRRPASLNVLARRVLALFEEYVALHRRHPAEVVALVQGADIADAAGVRHCGASRRARSTCGRRCSRHRTSRNCSRRSARCSPARSSCCELERKIDEDVRGSLFQNQREFYLQEQLKAIHRELGRTTATT